MPETRDIMLTAPKLAALAVMIRDDHVLLVRRRNEPDAGLWGFPGGHVELGEPTLKAAVRELHEETGVTGRAVEYLTNIDVIVHDESGAVRFHFLLAAVLCAYVSGVPVANDDVSDARWVPVTDVLTRQIATSEHVDSVVKKAVGAMAQVAG